MLFFAQVKISQINVKVLKGLQTDCTRVSRASAKLKCNYSLKYK